MTQADAVQRPAPGCIKAILGNPAMIKAYSSGIPVNGKPVPDGAAMAKVEWAKKNESGPPYRATVPGRLIEVSFMVKDSKRFPGTNGWGYATFRNDAASGEWKAFGNSPAFATPPVDAKRRPGTFGRGHAD